MSKEGGQGAKAPGRVRWGENEVFDESKKRDRPRVAVASSAAVRESDVQDKDPVALARDEAGVGRPRPRYFSGAPWCDGRLAYIWERGRFTDELAFYDAASQCGDLDVYKHGTLVDWDDAEERDVQMYATAALEVAADDVLRSVDALPIDDPDKFWIYLESAILLNEQFGDLDACESAPGIYDRLQATQARRMRGEEKAPKGEDDDDEPICDYFKSEDEHTAPRAAYAWERARICSEKQFILAKYHSGDCDVAAITPTIPVEDRLPSSDCDARALRYVAATAEFDADDHLAIVCRYPLPPACTLVVVLRAARRRNKVGPIDVGDAVCEIYNGIRKIIVSGGEKADTEGLP